MGKIFSFKIKDVQTRLLVGEVDTKITKVFFSNGLWRDCC